VLGGPQYFVIIVVCDVFTLILIAKAELLEPSVERYKRGGVFLGKAAELAGLPLGQMMTVLAEFGVESKIEKEDYLQGLENLQKLWQALDDHLKTSRALGFLWTPNCDENE
jgi:predicted HTH domain antitoxin